MVFKVIKFFLLDNMQPQKRKEKNFFVYIVYRTAQRNKLDLVFNKEWASQNFLIGSENAQMRKRGLKGQPFA